MLKMCSKCKIDKKTTDFYTDARATDGLRSSCKECYGKMHKAYKQTERGKEVRRAYDLTTRKNHPEKCSARQEVRHALRKGTLVKQPCHCGEVAEAHHEDYSKPLDVQWLCKKHHDILHRKEYLCESS